MIGALVRRLLGRDGPVMRCYRCHLPMEPQRDTPRWQIPIQVRAMRAERAVCNGAYEFALPGEPSFVRCLSFRLMSR